ncbi:zinc finger protein 37-like [Homarus americanus]|uniref:zinc finger protein 37-like n=1 Tax=Homarus americanus TaxID=6706 RepID=UPI001C47920A|nr:zinc finger protein 37-like [Homarus americanus]XP_042240856.1 zinc finger protein 37-like [Homarus americanus]
MSESEDGSILGGSGPLDMNIVSLPKMDAAQLDQLGLNGHAGTLSTSGLTSLAANPQQYAPASSGSTQAILERVIAQGPRALSNVSPAVTFTTAGSSAQDSYGSLEYVTQMPLQDDQQAKFPDTLVSVDNVAFVDMNDAAIKGATASTPLELYFDVMNPTTTAAPTTSSGHHVRHEHQNPKSQLLERAYSDIFLQQQEQQQQQQQTQDQEPEHILPDVTTANLVQIEHEGLSHTLHDYRKPNKLEIQKRQLQQQLQQQQQQERQLQQQHQEQQQQHQQRQLQHPHRLQQQQKSFQFQQPQQRQVQQQLQQQLHQKHHHQQQQQQSQLQHQQKQFQQQIPKTQEQNSQDDDQEQQQQQQHTTQHMPLVSRSGRPIRRRPEYVEYVSQNLKEEEILPHLPEQLVKVEAMVIGTDYEEEDPMEEVMEEDDPLEDEMDSNDEDPETSGNYSTDGKKSLPHKKRIPKKLKTTKKHVKCYKCAQCGEQFTNQQQFAAHKQTHTPPPMKPKPFKCEICAKGFDSQLKFFEHLKIHYEPYKKHKCEVCSGEFESADALQEHSLVHSREHFTCELCNKTFRKESMLEVHLKVAHMEEEETNSIDKPYTCVACPKSYRTQMALDSHVQSEHSENPPEFNCEDCYRVFKSKTKLVTHRKTEHKEEGPQNKGAPKKKIKIGKAVKGGYACSICPRVFTHKNSLVYHIRGHTGERPHQCEQCGKAFYAASALKVHQRLHSGEKPYKCQLCEKYFRQWGDLRYHTTSVHSEDRQYQCEYCGKDFKRKYCLVVHRRIHTGEKNYKCDFCNKAFRAASYLQNHKRIHTGERPHPCPDCGKPFRVRSDMKRHRQTHMRDAAGSGSGVGTPASGHVNQGGTQSPSPAAQVVPGTISQANSQPQLILSDQVSVPGNVDQPIRIMVSSLNAQQVTTAVHPPPAHRQSQHVTVPVSGNIATLTTGPVSPGGTTTTLSPEVIIMDDNTHQPINLNIIPRMITQEQVASSPHTSHATLVTTEEEYLANSGRNTLEVRGEEGSVYVWHGVFTD